MWLLQLVESFQHININSQRKKNQKRNYNSNILFIKELNANLKVTHCNGKTPDQLCPRLLVIVRFLHFTSSSCVFFMAYVHVWLFTAYHTAKPAVQLLVHRDNVMNIKFASLFVSILFKSGKHFFVA